MSARKEQGIRTLCHPDSILDCHRHLNRCSLYSFLTSKAVPPNASARALMGL